MNDVKSSSQQARIRIISFLVLVGISIGTQTFFKVSQRGGKYEYNTVSAMTIVEGVKLLIAMTQLRYEGGENFVGYQKSFENVSSRVYISYTSLAFLYALYNQLIFVVMDVADPGIFSLFKSLVPVIVSFLNFVVYGQTLTLAQIYCLCIQVFGLVPVSVSGGEGMQVDFTYGLRGLLLMVGAIFFGGFNTVYNASVVKNESKNYSISVQNSILYFAGFIINLIVYFATKKPGGKGFFYGYGHPGVIILLILNSIVGITISMVYKYGDAVLKTLAQPFVSSVLIFISYIFFGMPLDVIKVSGAGVVIIATLLYLKLPSSTSSTDSAAGKVETPSENGIPRQETKPPRHNVSKTYAKTFAMVTLIGVVLFGQNASLLGSDCTTVSIKEPTDKDHLQELDSASNLTDVFILLPGVEMDERDTQLFNETMTAALRLYPEDYVHIVYNTGNPTYNLHFDEKQHVVQHNNMALGGFTAAAIWMERFRPNGNFAILQHDVKLIARTSPPACDIETLNLRSRCGSNCTDYHKLHKTAGMKEDHCYDLLSNIAWNLYGSTCAYPCCEIDSVSQKGSHPHIEDWPLMAKNSNLFTPRARVFLKPLIEYGRKLAPGTMNKENDQATERLFGMMSAMMLEQYGPAGTRTLQYGNKFFPDPLDAYRNQIFLCGQDATEN